MRPRIYEYFTAYLTLFSGVAISAVAVYYSVAGLTAIFAAAVMPIMIMGIALELSKLVATIWLKQNWAVAPRYIKTYLIAAVTVLMLITSMGIFGYLSRAHNDQNLVSGEVLARIAVYDELIQNEKDRIDDNRKRIKQMDEAVDQIMSRSTTESSADKANTVRRSQQKDRGYILREIQSSQEKIQALGQERAPLAASARKIEAEVGPIKYIAAFMYGQTDVTMLERAVTWLIVMLIVVFDPLAIILLLASQISFQTIRERALPIETILQIQTPKATPEAHRPIQPLDQSRVVRTKVFPRVDQDPPKN